MPDRFTEILSFLKIVEAGSLSEAARRLDLSIAATSRRLANLEARLGVPLLRRNSRHLTLTDEGALFFEQAGRIVAEIDRAEAAVMRAATDATGTLRVATAIRFDRRRLASLLRDYASLHPEVRVHLDTIDQTASIVESGHDIGICFEPPPDSGLMMKRLADNPRHLCAAPAYLERRGCPETLADLARHDIIAVAGTTPDPWRAIGLEEAAPHRTLTTNDGALARLWALDGAGIALLSRWDIDEDLATGRLQSLMPDLVPPSCPVVALYHPAQGATVKVRSCLSFLARHMAGTGTITL